MTNSAHIFTTTDDSLEARIHAYKTMRKELHNIEASQKLSQDKEWQDRLGTEEELQQAQEQGLMTTEEAEKFSATKASFESPLDSKQAQIDKNKAEIQNARDNPINKELDKNNN